jgi:hypothetical protein
MWDGYAEADSSAQHGFSLLYRSEYLLERATGTVDQMMGEFGNDAGFIACG